MLDVNLDALTLASISSATAAACGAGSTYSFELAPSASAKLTVVADGVAAGAAVVWPDSYDAGNPTTALTLDDSVM